MHYTPFLGGREPSVWGYDTNGALLDSLLAQLVREDPDPPVVVIAGDFLAHGFPLAKAGATMAYLAKRFDATFPHAQFVITLGNNDSDCGDYESVLDGPFLHAVARAWEPLVNRHGAAPGFARTFSHDGGYTATLPVPHRRAVVINDIYQTVRYRNRCGSGNPAATSLGDLEVALRGGPPDERSWIVMHVPPGIDAYSTAHLGHHLFIVPFMRPEARERLVDAIDDPRSRVSLLIAGHTHHFAFRLTDAKHPARNVPILVAPSVSPIFGNSPSYLTLDVDAAGDVGNVAETSYVAGRWQRTGDLASEGVASFTAPALVEYEARLEANPALVERYKHLYSGGAASEISPRNYRTYWCAATALSAEDAEKCTRSGGISVFTGRALVLAGVVALLAAFAVFAIVRAIRRRRRAV